MAVEGSRQNRTIAAALACLAATILVYQILVGEAIGTDLLRGTLACAIAAIGMAAAFGRGPTSASRASRGPRATRPRAAASSGAGVDARARVDTGNRAALCLGTAACSVAGVAAVCAAGMPGTAVVPFVPQAAEAGSSVGAGIAAAVLAAVCCPVTAFWEEALFRGLLPEAFAEGMEKGRGRSEHGRVELVACAAASVVFAVLHSTGSGGDIDAAALCADPGERLSAMRPWALGALRCTGAFLFGIAMCAVARKAGGLRSAVLAHAAYDFVCFVPSAPLWEGCAAAAGRGAAGYLAVPVDAMTAVATDPLFIVVSTACLVAPAVLAAHMLRA